MLPDRASTRSRRYLARRRTFPKARWPATVCEKPDFLKRTKSKSKSYPVEVLERIDSSPQRQTQSHALGNLTSLFRALATPGQWPCSSSSFLLLLVLELVEVVSRTRTRDEDEHDKTSPAGQLTQLHSWGNLTSLLRAPAKREQWPCSSSSVVLLLVLELVECFRGRGTRTSTRTTKHRRQGN